MPIMDRFPSISYVGPSGKNNFLSQFLRLCMSYSDPLQEPGTSKLLTLCLTHNEALLERAMLEGIKKEQGGRKSSGKRMWNICTIVFRDQRNTLWMGKGLYTHANGAMFFGQCGMLPLLLTKHTFWHFAHKIKISPLPHFVPVIL